MILFIDFENTGSKALEGIELLTESDVVYICAWFNAITSCILFGTLNMLS